jgi:hypothetical protein
MSHNNEILDLHNHEILDLHNHEILDLKHVCNMLQAGYQSLATQIRELKRDIVELQKDKASNVRPSPAAEPAAKAYHVDIDTPAASTYDPAKDPRAIQHQTMKWLRDKQTWVPI